MGFGRACAPVRCAHPSFWAHGRSERGAAGSPPPRPLQLRCFLFDPQKYIKSIELGPPTSRAFFFPLDHRGHEIWGPPAPRPAHRSFADPAGNIFGVKILYRCALIFWVFLFSIVTIGSFLFVVLFFFFSPFQLCLILLFFSLLILLVSTFLRLLILLFLYFSWLLYYRHAH